MTAAYEFSITYDQESVRCAARTMFTSTWRRPLIPIIVLGFVLGTGAVFYLNTIPELAIIKWICVGLVFLPPIGYVYLYRTMSQRMFTQLTGTANIKLTKSKFSLSSARGSSTVPWSAFQFLKRDERNILLYTSRIAAVIIPTEGIPDEAVEFLLRRVPAQ
jgi:hypothetical protein